MSGSYTQYAPVLYGIGAVNELPDQVKGFGANTVLCLYDRGVAGCGIGPRIMGILRDAGITAYAFEEVEPEPPDYQVDNIYNEYKDKGIELVIGLGGGSCMDTAKGVAWLFTFKKESIRPYLYHESRWMWADFPLILIPTASGTGSEVSPVAVITDTSCNFKGGILVHTSLALLDPELTKTAPPFVTATSGLDAFSHAAESMTTKVTNPKSDVLCTYALSNIMKYLPIAMEEPGNMEARNALSISANFAGIAFSSASVHLGHAMAETIGAAVHQPHGLCCALTVAPCMEYVGDYTPDRIKMVADAIGVDYADIADDGTAIGLRVGDAIRDLLRTCKVPSFADRGVTREQIMALVPDVVSNFHALKCPVPLTEEMAEKYLARICDAY
ncbi:MAG: iron-containing alcohol dehydrogenase [Eggerthellaceae bacterium]|nr:iron-containing alcohol dehydrogenase [Eggerthellaceae bacterium]